jgi:hypothetical protein
MITGIQELALVSRSGDECACAVARVGFPPSRERRSSYFPVPLRELILYPAFARFVVRRRY